MFFTARKPIPRNRKDSHSKESRQSIGSKSKNKGLAISTAQLKLREAITSKFLKSKIKGFRYGGEGESEQESGNSEEMEEYENLKGRRFINLKDYHRPKQENICRQYMIRKRHPDSKRTSGVTKVEESSSVNGEKTPNMKKNKLPRQLEKSFHERRVLSGEKYS